jgi:hypothetical protein
MSLPSEFQPSEGPAADPGAPPMRPTPPTSDRGGSELQRQLQLVRDHCADAFQSTNPLVAAVAVGHANVMELQLHLTDAVRKFVEIQPLTIHNLPAVLPAIEKVVRLTILSNQSTHLEIELARIEGLGRPHRPR